MRPDRQALVQLAAPQDDHRLAGVADQAALGQTFRRDDRPAFEPLGQGVEVDFLVLEAEDVVEAALKGQAASQRQLAAFKVEALA